jgi:hypothetical protein
VFLNDKCLCLAGIAGNCILNVMITHLKQNGDRDEVHLRVGGLKGLVSGEHVDWVSTQLSEYDEVRVRIIESDSTDEPKDRKPRNPEKELEQHKEHVRAMAKQLRWTLTEPST